MAKPKVTKNAVSKVKVTYPAKYTASTLAQFISQKHEISIKQSKEIVEDLFDVVSAGVLKGERVPVGKIGKIYVRLRPATKSRLGRNPITGQEITIPAKKASKVPKFTFSKGFKEIATKANIKQK